MTEDTPTVPAAIVCDVEGCHVLVPDTLADRSQHRRGHKHDEKVEDAIRRRLRELQADFDKLRGEFKEKTAEMKRDVEGIDRTVGQIEIPEQTPPLEIRRGGWDDLDDEDDTDDTADDWGFSTPEPATTVTRADAVAAFTTPAISPVEDEDDLDDPTRPIP